LDIKKQDIQVGQKVGCRPERVFGIPIQRDHLQHVSLVFDGDHVLRQGINTVFRRENANHIQVRILKRPDDVSKIARDRSMVTTDANTRTAEARNIFQQNLKTSTSHYYLSSSMPIAGAC
jgi:hypothetical protein